MMLLFVPVWVWLHCFLIQHREGSRGSRVGEEASALAVLTWLDADKEKRTASREAGGWRILVHICSPRSFARNAFLA